MRSIFSGFGLLITVTFILVRPICCQAGPTITVGLAVPSAERLSLEKIDHSAWDALLKRYVDANGSVDYAKWKASVTDTKALDDYVNHLSAAIVEKKDSRDAQLAFWINAYNSVTVKGILREYPTSSIRNHTAKLYGYNIWKDLKLIVTGQQYSLEDIEHKILRKMGEPRIHFAIVCASIGCPRLLNEAYTAERIDEQLTVNSKAFFADRTKFSIDGQTINVSPILTWFAEDFGTDTNAQMKTISPYLPEPAQKLARSGAARVKYLEYDWGLNDRKAGR